MIDDKTKEMVTAVAEATKAGIELTDKTAGSIIQELCGMASDRVQFWRAKQWLSIQDKWKAIHRQRGIEGKTVSMSPKLALPIIEAASLEEDETLQGLWANLIANAMDPEYTEKIHPSFTSVITQLCKDEALLLQAMHNSEHYPKMPFFHNRKDVTWGNKYDEFCKTVPLKYPERQDAYLTNFIRLQMLGLYMSGNIVIAGRYQITPFGEAFIAACLPYSYTHPPAAA